jgi:hypothetical protein
MRTTTSWWGASSVVDLTTHKDWRGAKPCPLCAGEHKLKECTAPAAHYKSINCLTFTPYTKGDKKECRSSLDKNCPSLQAVLAKCRINPDYWQWRLHPTLTTIHRIEFKRKDVKLTKSLQLNLQHTRVATENLTQTILQYNRYRLRAATVHNTQQSGGVPQRF